MKTLKNAVAAPVSVLILILFLFSCSKNALPEVKPVLREESTLYITIVPGTPEEETRASGSEQGVQAEDNTVRCLEIFIFREEGAAAGELESYKKFEGDALSGLTNLEVKATTGAKKIYAVANSHKAGWKGITTLEQFRTVASSLQDENVKNFVMIGSTDITLQVTTSVSLSLSRLVARINLASLKTDFAGTPYEGMKLTNVRIYLINVPGNKLYHNGKEPLRPVILNYKKFEPEDIDGCAMSGMLYDRAVPDISDAGYTVNHYFYCYENLIEAETDALRFTRLVIQGDLNGHTYYYPVNINREGAGYDPSNGHKGILRNTGYTVHVTILRPGSGNPDESLERGTAVTALNVLDWTTVPAVNVEF